MLFVYPAVISDKVDRKYLPGLLKTMELYFLHTIVSDVAMNNVQFRIRRSRITGKYSDIRLESTYLPEDLGFDYEYLNEQFGPDFVEDQFNTVNKSIDELNNAIPELELRVKRMQSDLDVCKRDDQDYKNWRKEFSKQYDRLTSGPGRSADPAKDARERTIDILGNEPHRPDCARAERDYNEAFAELRDSQAKLKDEIRHKQSLSQQISRTAADIEKEKREKEPSRQGTVGGAGSLKIDTTSALDLRPTSTTISAKVEVITPDKLDPFPDRKLEDREIPISVKIIPVFANNFDDLYGAMVKDYFSNQYSKAFKMATRGFLSGISRFLSPVARLLFRYTKSKDSVDIYKDIILNKQGIINASSFKTSGAQRGKAQKYSSAIVLMSIDDIKNPHSKIFNDPNKLQHLYQMGWKSIGIADDKDQEFTFCSGLEGGMCTKIPYSYTYKSLQASDLYKDADQLSRFTSRVIGKFKRINFRALTAEASVVKKLTIAKVQTLFEKFGGK